MDTQSNYKSKDGDTLKPVRLRKAIMRVGEFHTPDGAHFSITRTRLDHWVRTFSKMSQNGDVCRIVKDHQEDVGSSIGKIISMERRGEYLYATLEFPTREMADLTLTNDVSIYSQPQYTTGCGVYRDAIKHVSLTPFPLIPHLGGYKRLGENAPLVCSINHIVKKEGKFMDESLSKVLDMIAQFLGMEPPEEARSTNEAAISWLAAMFQAAGQTKTEPEPKDEDKTAADADEDKDDENLPEGADQIIASVNGARKLVLNGFIGYQGVSAQQVGKWVNQFANCKSFKKQIRTREAFDSLVEGLRCSVNGKTNVLHPSSGKQVGGEGEIAIPGFEKLMALRK